MEIGAYSFGDTPIGDDGEYLPTDAAITNLHSAIVHADRVGLDYFAVGEHHTADMPASSPGTMIAAAAAATEQIKLGSGVSIISTDDPVRVFQQFATADIISGGRVEITAGRGSSIESFPLFGYDLSDYDALFAEKLELLTRVNSNSTVTWHGHARPSFADMPVVPRPASGSLPLWLGTGGNPGSTVRAGELGLPISYGIIGGVPARFGRLADLYRATAKRAGHSGENIKVSVAALGLVAPTKEEALERFYPGWHRLNEIMGKSRGWPPPDDRAYYAQASAPGAYYVGDPDDVAERIADLYQHMGHMRHLLQMDIGSTPHEYVMESIDLLATEVKPRVARLLEKA